jgi:TrmH family RNA methyltransferase
MSKQALSGEQITSIKDPRVVEARELATAAGRARRGKALLEGAESLGWALDAGATIEQVFYHAAAREDPVLARLVAAGVPCAAVSEGIAKKISDTAYLVPLLGVVALPPEPASPAGDFVLVLDHVQDHGNLGTIVRTAGAFGIRDLVATHLDLDLYFKKTVAASRGKVFDVRLRRFPAGGAAVRDLQARGYQIVATSPHARDIQALAPLQRKPVALVVGNETAGVGDDILALADVVVQIPMSGPVESLNVGVATGISVYELKVRMVLAMLVNYIRANLGREVNVTGKLIQQAFDAQLRRVSDLNSTQVILLMMLACDESIPEAQAARDTATSGADLAALLAPLFARGLIARLPDATPPAIRITEAGERTLAQLWSVVERADAAIVAGFSDAEQAQLHAFLQRIQANCAHVMAGPA